MWAVGSTYDAAEMSELMKEDPMVPGITDTECRIAEFQHRALLAEAERQRMAASAAFVRSHRAGVMGTVQCHIHTLGSRVSRVLHVQGVRTVEAMENNAVRGTLAVGK
jgi:hypothetical protein